MSDFSEAKATFDHLGNENELTAGREHGSSPNLRPAVSSTGRPRGYAPWRPKKATRPRVEQVKQVLAEYAEYLPLTVRQIFYRLVAQFGYDKTENAYNRLADTLVRARRSKTIPFDAIRDDGVVTVATKFYNGIEDFQNETGRRAKKYRRDRQDGQDVRLELWCEAAGMLQQLTRVANQYSVPVYSCGGFASLTANYEIAKRAVRKSVPTVLLHVGDFDPSGESIFEAMATDAAAFVNADRSIQYQRLEAVRVALTSEQVAHHELPTAPAKTSDTRSKNWKGGETCQLEALDPSTLASVVKAAIEEWLDLDRYQEVLDEERGQRAELLGLPSGE